MRNWLPWAGMYDRMLRQLLRQAFRSTKPCFVVVSLACLTYPQEHLPRLEAAIPAVSVVFAASNFDADQAVEESEKFAGR